MNDERLDPDEDAELRRLHMLRGFGAVAGSITSRYDSLRGRDRRKNVRDPEDGALAAPIEKKLWADPPAATGSASKAAASDPQRVVGDSREVFAQRPEPRRGLGIFRR